MKFLPNSNTARLSAAVYLLGTAGITLAGEHATGEAQLEINHPTTEDPDWAFSFELNLWGPEIDSVTASGSSIQLGLDDILSDLNIVMMSSFEMRKARWFVGGDMIYMDLQQSLYASAGPLGLKSDINLSSWIITPVAGYRLLEGERGHFDLLAGGRYHYMSVETKNTLAVPVFGSTTVFLDEDLIEWAGVAGFKGHYQLSPHWYLPFYFDIGAGEPQITLQAFAGLGYQAESFDVTLGYRYLKWNPKAGAAVSHMEVKGPMLGIGFAF